MRWRIKHWTERDPKGFRCNRKHCARELDVILKRCAAPLDSGGEVIEIDTTDFDKVDYADLFAKVANVLETCRQ